MCTRVHFKKNPFFPVKIRLFSNLRCLANLVHHRIIRQPKDNLTVGTMLKKLRGYLLPFFRGKQNRERNWKIFRVELAKILKKAEKVATLFNECAVSISFIAKMFISSCSGK